MTTLELHDDDRGRTVDVAAGGTVEIHLRENPTTGYRWAIDRVEGPLAAVDDRFDPGGGAPGGGGTRVLTFATSGAGTCKVLLKHLREWEGDASVTERWDATVVVT